MLTTSLLLAVFLGALVSGWHCALMCGGIAAAIERPSTLESPLRAKSELFYLQLVMHLGRVTTYVLLGALAAWIGVVVWQQNLLPIQRSLFILTSLLLIYMGFRLLGLGKSEGRIGGRWLNTQIASYWAKYLGRFASGPSRWFSGMLWGLVPCGLVYSVLPLAFLSGDVFTGAALMLAFGLGTLPNLLLISKFSAALTQFGQYQWVRYLAVLLLFTAGGFGLYRAWVLPEALLKGGFCIS
ncbi:sulfite exporter TauE/SafE family protein [Polynucleobacter sp. AP-Titi-500A-B4]|jgi:sulfite exporter TauE/SafE|uniref:sulfite exporter TauE/SafE family protein n=1 Tax=Polynucleobacter sp. AP-Titi-500A-B4 TaxID=2576923 RepID=UPI001BFD7A7A|nr:sulfite exporter TauE/SafE family protein [Polynucleobacter sp. AP-Titi-500A-B4]QWE12005.1 sulfite exporter TauE/SafE family protein [Polynucleobacter sp. AP-Titi-500A-B4]